MLALHLPPCCSKPRTDMKAAQPCCTLWSLAHGMACAIRASAMYGERATTHSEWADYFCFCFSSSLPFHGPDPGSRVHRKYVLLSLPHSDACLHFYRESESVLSSLGEPRRVMLTYTFQFPRRTASSYANVHIPGAFGKSIFAHKGVLTLFGGTRTREIDN